MADYHGGKSTLNPDKVSSNEVTTDDIIINNSVTDPAGNTQTGGALHLLRKAGFSSGDFIPILEWGARNSNSNSSSSTYSNVGSQGALRTVIGTHIPSDATLQAYFSAQFEPGSDQIDARLRNTTDDQTAAEVTGITSAGMQEVGPVDYSPTTTGSPTVHIIQIRNNDDSTSIVYEDGYQALGVQL